VSPRTIKSYRDTGEEFAGWLGDQGMPTDEIGRSHV